MSLRLIVPHRGLEAAKTRLASVLTDEQREELARTLLERVLRVAHEAADDVVVITPAEPLRELVEAADDVVVITPAAPLRELVEPAGARIAVQRGMGLNAGLDQARAQALRDGVGELVVLHGDLPNLAADDVRALIAAFPSDAGDGVAIAPDRAGTGTNALALRPPGPFTFRFGVGSCAAHRSEAEVRGLRAALVERPGLAFDLDTPDDLERWLRLGDAA